MRVLSIRLPDWMIEMIDRLVENGVFISRSEFIRFCIRRGFKQFERELERLNPDRGKILRIGWKVNMDKELDVPSEVVGYCNNPNSPMYGMAITKHMAGMKKDCGTGRCWDCPYFISRRELSETIA